MQRIISNTLRLIESSIGVGLDRSGKIVDRGLELLRNEPRESSDPKGIPLKHGSHFQGFRAVRYGSLEVLFQVAGCSSPCEQVGMRIARQLSFYVLQRLIALALGQLTVDEPGECASSEARPE